jgi:hypothetical protein
MKSTEDRKSKAAEDMEAAMEVRDETRREAERTTLKELNQGMGLGSHEAVHRGVNWGPSYRTKRKKGKSKRNGGNQK